jgi:hypothetical protein
VQQRVVEHHHRTGFQWKKLNVEIIDLLVQDRLEHSMPKHNVTPPIVSAV